MGESLNDPRERESNPVKEKPRSEGLEPEMN
jgi:hypothetical protein